MAENNPYPKQGPWCVVGTEIPTNETSLDLELSLRNYVINCVHSREHFFFFLEVKWVDEGQEQTRSILKQR